MHEAVIRSLTWVLQLPAVGKVETPSVIMGIAFLSFLAITLKYLPAIIASLRGNGSGKDLEPQFVELKAAVEADLHEARESRRHLHDRMYPVLHAQALSLAELRRDGELVRYLETIRPNTTFAKPEENRND
jgi:hypothetical protein